MPDYDYRNGVNVRTFDAYTGGIVEETHLPRDAVRRPDVKTLSDLEDASKVPHLLGSSESDFKVDSLYFKADKNLADGSVIIIQYPWGDHIDRDVCRDAAILAAAAHRASDVYALSPAGYARSTQLPKSVRREMAKTGRFMPGAELIWPALAKVVAKSDRTEFTGVSEGGRKSIALGALATGAEISVEADDSPGPGDPGYFKFLNLFAIKEASHSKKYRTAETTIIDDPIQTKLQEAGDAYFASQGLFRSKLFGGGHNHVADLVWREPNAMRRREGYMDDMRDLLANKNVKQVEIMIPEMSELNDPQNMWKGMQMLAREKAGENVLANHDEPFTPEIYFSVLGDQTHMFFVARGAVTAQLYGRTLARR